MMLLVRLRKGEIDDDDFKFITRTMQSLVYKTRADMAHVMKLSPRSIRRIFNGEQITAPQQRVAIFERYLRAVEAALDHPQFRATTTRQKPKPKHKRYIT